jgi:hypothetical protein
MVYDLPEPGKRTKEGKLNHNYIFASSKIIKRIANPATLSLDLCDVGSLS